MSMTAALATGILLAFAAQPAQAGISVSAFAGVNPITGLNGATASPGTDPASLPVHQIALASAGGVAVVGGNTLGFTLVSFVQSYTPLIGPPSGLVSALGDTTTVTIANLSGPAVTITLTVTYDSYNYPTRNPLTWTSTIATSRLDGGATYGSSETVSPGGGSLTHTTLTAPGSQTLTKSISPGRPFSVTQTLTIFLPTGAVANIQKSDTLKAVPEPTTMAIAGLGALGMIGYGLRRRRGA